jgi:hypothetical protein
MSRGGSGGQEKDCVSFGVPRLAKPGEASAANVPDD